MPGGSMRPGPNMTTSLVAGDISLRQNEWEKILGVRPLPTSSAKKTGLRNLWRAILREMDIAVDDGNTPEPEKVLPGDSEN